MDITTIGGLIGAIISLCVGDFLEGGNPLHLIHISSLIIIIPTAMCAASSATHATHIKGAMKELKIVFGSTGVNLNEIIRQLVELATLARKDGVLALEGKAAQIEDDFLRQSLSKKSKQLDTSPYIPHKAKPLLKFPAHQRYSYPHSMRKSVPAYSYSTIFRIFSGG